MPLLKNTKLKLSELEHQSNLITNDVGDFIFMNNKNLKRFQIDTLEDLETEWLKQAGIGCADRDTFFYNAHQFKKALRNSPQKKLNYLMRGLCQKDVIAIHIAFKKRHFIMKTLLKYLYFDIPYSPIFKRRLFFLQQTYAY